MAQVSVYTQNVCKYCNILKVALIGNSIEFEVKNIDKNPVFKEELVATGYMTTPVTAIVDGDKTHYVSGNDVAQIQEILSKTN